MTDVDVDYNVKGRLFTLRTEDNKTGRKYTQYFDLKVLTGMSLIPRERGYMLLFEFETHNTHINDIGPGFARELMADIDEAMEEVWNRE